MSPKLGPGFGLRFLQLQAGLIGFGVSMALMVRARLGLGPWDVFHQGAARALGLSIGTVVIGTGALVLLGWIPLRQLPGIGTAFNVVVIGVVVDVALVVIPMQHAMAARVAMLVGGIVLNGIATAFYIGAGLGPGPRDGLMTGFAARGHSIRVVRTALELVVLLVGALLGGSVGVGTVLFALTIGPLTHHFLPLLAHTRLRPS